MNSMKPNAFQLQFVSHFKELSFYKESTKLCHAVAKAQDSGVFLQSSKPIQFEWTPNSSFDVINIVARNS